MAQAIHKGPEAVRQLLAAGADPNEVMTGGARPLHTCGMSRSGQLSTQVGVWRATGVSRVVLRVVHGLARKGSVGDAC